MFCPNCQKNDKDKNFFKCKIKYSIKSFPKFLFVIFDMGYDDLITNKNNIIRYTPKRINLI